MSESRRDVLERLTAETRARIIKALPVEKQAEIASGRAWWFDARPEQLPPPGDWRFWLVQAGRGFGKTLTAAQWCVEKARRYPGCRVAVVAPTFADGRDTCVEGETGLLSVLDPAELRGGSVESAWNRSLGELFLGNGSQFKVYTSERPRQIRGPQVHFAWGEECVYWADADRGTGRDSTFSNLNIILRLTPRPGWDSGFRAQCVLTTTPRPVALLKVPDAVLADHPYLAGLLQRRDVHVTRGRTEDNIHNLSAGYRASVVDPLVGTTLGRQELGGELLEDVEGALLNQGLIDETRVGGVDRVLARRAVALDPAGGGGLRHDEHGILVAGVAGSRDDPEFYFLADRSKNCSVEDAARRAIHAYREFDAHALVVESNLGRDWLRATIMAEFRDMREPRVGEAELPWDMPAPRVELVPAVKDKSERARPLKTRWEQRRVHVVGVMPLFEGQLTTWVPGDSDSPDRVDAGVWAVSWLDVGGSVVASVASAAGREGRLGRRPNMPSTRMPLSVGGRR